MAAGRLKHRVAFDQRGVASDGIGGVEADWSQQFVVAAGFTPRFGGEQVMAARLTGVQPVTVTIRSTARTRAIGTDWRLRDVTGCDADAVADGDVALGVPYNIRSVADPSDRRHYLDLLCDNGAPT